MDRLGFASYSRDFVSATHLLTSHGQHGALLFHSLFVIRAWVHSVYCVRCCAAWCKQCLLMLSILVSGQSLAALDSRLFPHTSPKSALYANDTPRMLVGGSSLFGTEAKLCMFSDSSLLLGSKSTPSCVTSPLPSVPTPYATPSPACAHATRSPANNLLSLQLVPTLIAASLHVRKQLIVLAHFRGGLICDVTPYVSWQANTLSVWLMPSSTTFFLLQAKLANHFSNRAFIKGTMAR